MNIEVRQCNRALCIAPRNIMSGSQRGPRTSRDVTTWGPSSAASNDDVIATNALLALGPPEIPAWRKLLWPNDDNDADTTQEVEQAKKKMRTDVAGNVEVHHITACSFGLISLPRRKCYMALDAPITLGVFGALPNQNWNRSKISCR